MNNNSNELNKAEIVDILIKGFNIYAKHEKNFMTKDYVDKIINEEAEKILREKK